MNKKDILQMDKKELIIPIISIIAIIATFAIGFAIESQELSDDKDSITISNLKANFEKDSWGDYYNGNITGILKSNKSFDSVSGEIEYYDSSGTLMSTSYISNPTKIVEGQTYKISESYFSMDSTKPSTARIIFYNNDYRTSYRSQESILFEKKINI